MDNKIGTYRAVDFHGKSQLELLIQVYDGAINSYKTAKKEYEANNLEAGYVQLEKAKKFITHLYTTLDHKKGGEVAESLEKIYVFVLNETNVLEATKESSKFDDIVYILGNLRSGWSELKNIQVASDRENSQTANSETKKELSITA